MKRVVLCADDFGQDAAVDAAVLRLLSLGRLTAVSCLACGPRFPGDAPELLGAGRADAGLHLDLTGGSDGAPPVRLPWLLLRAWARALDRRVVEGRIQAQLDAFERAARRPPDFVDGHQHVHQFPGIREPLVELLVRRYGPAPPYVRSTVPLRPAGVKARTVAALGGRALRAALDRNGIPYNRDFLGVYALDPGEPYGERMRRWLLDVADGGLILCHPGEPGGPPGDPIAPARAAELRYLLSAAFPEDCAAAGVELARFAGTRAPRGAAGGARP